MKRYILYTIISLLSSKPVFSQTDITINSHRIQSQLMNPAALHEDVNDNSLEFNLLGQKQWYNMPGAPSSYVFDGYVYLINYKTKMGLQIISDQIGYTYNRKISLQYAYNLNINEYDRLRMGLSAGLYSYSHDLSQISMDDMTDPAVRFLDDNKMSPFFNLGVEYASENLVGGITVRRLECYFNKDKGSPTEYAYARYTSRDHYMYNLMVSTSAMHTSGISAFDINSALLFKNSEDLETWWIGIGWRSTSELMFDAGIRLAPRIAVNYNYAYNYGVIRKYSTGTHELSLTYSGSFSHFFCLNCRD